MSNYTTNSRRQFIKHGCVTIAAIPLFAFVGQASATTNAAMRNSMKYQDKPNAEKDCAGCVQFVPGKTAADLGGCKIFPGDTEVSPKGYCVAWAVKPK
jgi:hypothetical protein